MRMNSILFLDTGWVIRCQTCLAELHSEGPGSIQAAWEASAAGWKTNVNEDRCDGEGGDTWFCPDCVKDPSKGMWLVGCSKCDGEKYVFDKAAAKDWEKNHNCEDWDDEFSRWATPDVFIKSPEEVREGRIRLEEARARWAEQEDMAKRKAAEKNRLAAVGTRVEALTGWRGWLVRKVMGL